MESKKKLYLSFAMNIFIFLATTGVVISYFFGNDGQYHIEPSFRFNLFTTDSNILCGAAAFVMAIFQIRQMKHNKPVPRWVFFLKYTGTCALAVTFLQLCCFLVRQWDFWKWSLAEHRFILMRQEDSDLYRWE